ncbi:uncharacterized protein LOC128344892 isoform X1 [Hemicordylus capensis]|uniref:uncharacterized protein LOC128344892 isoform X1 n=1 Tax=Hemicordylus capensis TaxID=884348 RepID=UPI002304BAB5|nr:uncharacterized protein LOC128344892 isoform X1 [Hemicordylus capensis]XP_053151883.1 uncharacterized protein LOC128344892 isoform X1 [Hemicordylus capensis]XP_053151884.1 uncharacterized protein LOC128344892 isoform X1 [Hemicordylus capensis]XP_053151885.1 uncharacterized protein LOC128344892 isoform X1 [Hemicordylus capensis]XP_053151886.1 uncharacterized protein LOC128344892 isoform X1 [Hemicordylus capensis]
MKTLWHCCRNCKVSPQDHKPLEAKQELNPDSKTERLGVSGTDRLGFSSGSLETKGTESDLADSSEGTLDYSFSTVPSTELDPSVLHDADTITNVMENIKIGEQSFLDNSEETICFLRSISACCVAAHKSGRNTLELPYSKAELTEAIVIVLETLPIHSVPSSILSCCILAVYNLSKIKPPLDSELESCVLRLALHGIFNMETLADAHSQALYRSSSDTMNIMLKGLLAELPTTSHLLFMLEHISFWLHSKYAQERYRAMKCITSLLRHAVFLMNFDRYDELPALGHHVAQLGICITDSAEDVSRQAREAISCIYELLLHQMRLNMNAARALWSSETEDNRKLLAYLDTCKVGEVFRKIFTEDQKRAFLQTALLATYDPLLRKSEAGILLVFSLLGKANELLGEEVGEIKKLIFKQLHKLRTCKEVPEALQSLILS